jgi:Tol biopolymer transport system component
MRARRIVVALAAGVLVGSGPLAHGVAAPAAPPLPSLPSPPSPYGLLAGVDGPGVYVVGADGQGLRRLADGAGLPSWSPDGRRIAWVAGPGDVVVGDVAGGAGRVVGTGHSTLDAAPSWSPDGTRLAYPGHGEGFERDVWIAHASGATAPRQLARPGDDAEVAWGPDGRIATAGAGLVISEPDGSNPLRIAGGGNYGPLKWSPDGTMLVNLPDSTAIDLVVNADGTHPRMLADSGRLGLSIYQADWAPSSGELVYYENAYRTGHTVIGIASADGSPGREIASDAFDPAWSPRGDGIAVIEHTGDGGAPKAALTWGSQLLSDLVVFTPDGSSRRVVVRSALNLSTPVWSPDGAVLAFVAR